MQRSIILPHGCFSFFWHHICMEISIGKPPSLNNSKKGVSLPKSLYYIVVTQITITMQEETTVSRYTHRLSFASLSGKPVEATFDGHDQLLCFVRWKNRFCNGCGAHRSSASKLRTSFDDGPDPTCLSDGLWLEDAERYVTRGPRLKRPVIGAAFRCGSGQSDESSRTGSQNRFVSDRPGPLRMCLSPRIGTARSHSVGYR